MSSDPVVLTERDGPVFIVSINRPKAKNAVNFATANALGNLAVHFNLIRSECIRDLRKRLIPESCCANWKWWNILRRIRFKGTF